MTFGEEQCLVQTTLRFCRSEPVVGIEGKNVSAPDGRKMYPAKGWGMRPVRNYVVP